MKLMVVGGGGREHAIIKSLKKNPSVTEIFALPGNGGMADDATLVPIGAKEIDKIAEFARDEGIDGIHGAVEHYGIDLRDERTDDCQYECKYHNQR